MHHMHDWNRRSLLLKGIGLVAAMTLIWFAGIAPAQASSCEFARNINITYYSSAAHTMVVGRCSNGPCPGAGCTGTKSSFATASESAICEICT